MPFKSRQYTVHALLSEPNRNSFKNLISSLLPPFLSILLKFWRETGCRTWTCRSTSWRCRRRLSSGKYAATSGTFTAICKAGNERWEKMDNFWQEYLPLSHHSAITYLMSPQFLMDNWINAYKPWPTSKRKLRYKLYSAKKTSIPKCYAVISCFILVP